MESHSDCSKTLHTRQAPAEGRMAADKHLLSLGGTATRRTQDEDVMPRVAASPIVRWINRHDKFSLSATRPVEYKLQREWVSVQQNEQPLEPTLTGYFRSEP